MNGNQLATAARVAAPLFFAALVAFSLIAWRAAEQEDALWAADRRAAAAAAWSAQQRDLGKTIVDYAYWDEAAERLAARDVAWAQENLGASTYETFGWSLTAALAADGSPIVLFEQGVMVDPGARPALLRVLSNIAARATIAPSGRPTAVLEPARVNGALLLIAAAAATPHSPEKTALVAPSAPAVVVMARALDAATLADLGEAFRLPDLHDDPAPHGPGVGDPNRLEIADSTGLPLGALVWRFEPPGLRLLQREAPLFVLLAVGLAVVGWFVSRRIGRLALDRAEMVRNLRVARREATAADRAKTQFLSLVSHELFTPLNGVMGFAELIRVDQGADRAQINQYADVLLERAQHLHQLISDVVAAAGIDPLAPPILTETVELVGLCADVAASLTHLTGDGAATLVCSGVAPVWAKANGELLRQAVGRLLTQSLSWTPPGESVMLSIYAADHAPRLVIEDRGPGLSPELVQAFARPFSFDAASLHRGEEGLGLSLFIARGLIVAAGAALQISPRLDGPGLRAMIHFAPMDDVPAPMGA